MAVRLCSSILRFARALTPWPRRAHRASWHRSIRVVPSLECLELRTLFSATSLPTVLLPNPLTGLVPAQSQTVSPGADKIPTQTSSSAESDDATEIYPAGNSDTLGTAPSSSQTNPSAQDQTTSESDEYPLPPTRSASQNSNQTPPRSTIPVLLPLIAVEPGTNSSGISLANTNVKPTSDLRPPMLPEAFIGSPKPALATQTMVESSIGPGKVAHPDPSLALALLFELTSRSNGNDIGMLAIHPDLESPEFIAALAVQDRSSKGTIVQLGHLGSGFLMPPSVQGQLTGPANAHPIPALVQPPQGWLFNTPPILEPGIPDCALPLTWCRANPAQGLDGDVSPTDTGGGLTAEPIPIDFSRDGLIFSSLLAVYFSLAGGYGYILMRSIPEESYTDERGRQTFN